MPLLIATCVFGPLYFALEVGDDAIHWRSRLSRAEHVAHLVLASLAVCVALAANQVFLSPSAIPFLIIGMIALVSAEEIIGLHDRCESNAERVLHSVIFLTGTFLAMALHHLATQAETAMLSLFTLVCRALLAAALLRWIEVALHLLIRMRSMRHT